MSWNPVLNKFIEIKKEYISRFSDKDLFDYDVENESCLEYWVRKLNIPEYIDLIKPLQFTEYKDLLLIKYGDYSDVFSDEDSDITFKNFWELYDGFYLECRSVVIDIKNNILALTPFKKFRNINECEETSLENISNRIKNAKCVEFSDKLDGSMQSARYYKDKIIMSGSMALNPEMSWRLEDGYNMLRLHNGYEKMLKTYPNLTFIFEYISLRDAHVVNYTKEQEGLYLVGIRNVNTGEEYSYSDIKRFSTYYQIPTTTVFDKTLEEIMNELDDKKSDEAEGFVLNIDSYRVKIKYNDYVNVHHVLSAISSVNLVIRSIADNTFDDLLAKIPKAYKNRVFITANIVFKYINDTEKQISDYCNIAPKNDKKTFMIWVDNNVPRKLKGYVKSKYLGKEYNVIKPLPEKYLKLSEMGVSNYAELFKEED